MRFSLLLLVGLLCASLHYPLLAQNQWEPPCTRTGIVTDPSAPAYHPVPSRINTFNWYNGPLYGGRQYALNSPAINQNAIWLPWEQPNNANVGHISGKRDYPADGWELVRRDLGYDSDGAPFPDTRNPYVILYNRRQGVLRVFVAVGDLLTSYQFAEIRLMFSEDAPQKAATLNRQTALGVALEDTKPGTSEQFASVATFLNDRGKWFMADFPMDYDPCLCLFDSRLAIEVRLIEKANVRLIGETTGTLVTTGGTDPTSTNSDYADSPPFMRKVGKGVSAGGKAYKSVDKLTSKLTGKSAADIGAINSLKDAIKKSDFLKSGLSAVPWIGGAVGLLDYFLSGGKDGGPTNDPISLQPMTIEMSTTTTGTIEATSLYATIPFHNPGNRIANTIPEDFPFYNEAMGVFSLLKLPTVEMQITPDGSNQNGPLTRYSFRLPNNLEYVINPAARLRVRDFQAALVFEGPSRAFPTRPYYSYGGITAYEGPITKSDGILSYAYRTDYEDALCIKNNIFSYITGNSNSEFSHTNVYVKLILNLSPINCSTCQNVLYVARYPVNINAISSFGTLSYADCGVLPQASGPTLRAVCNSTKYISAITLPRSAKSPATTAPQKVNAVAAAVRLSVYPNPSSLDAVLRYTLQQTSRVRLSVFDALGREALVVLKDEQREAGSYEARINTADLAPGLYSCRLQADGEQITKKLSVVH